MNWQNAKDVWVKLIEEQRVGLISDMDGTLSPIVDHPDDAAITPRNRELLTKLQAVLPLTAVVSGRNAEDVYHRVGIKGLVAVGNHGMELWQANTAKSLPLVSGYRDVLEKALLAVRREILKGMLIEDKGITFSVHYRQTEKPEQVFTQIAPVMQKIAADLGLHLTQGRMVFEFRPPVRVNKGTAFSSLVNDYQLTGAIYLGDDTTDISAFQAARALRDTGNCLAYGFGVASTGTPDAVLAEADFIVQGISGVESFLDWILKTYMASFT